MEVIRKRLGERGKRRFVHGPHHGHAAWKCVVGVGAVGRWGHFKVRALHKLGRRQRLATRIGGAEMALGLMKLLKMTLSVLVTIPHSIGLGFGRATSPPVVPNIVPFGTVLNEKEESKSDTKCSIQAAEDHIQEVTHCYSHCP